MTLFLLNFIGLEFFIAIQLFVKTHFLFHKSSNPILFPPFSFHKLHLISSILSLTIIFKSNFLNRNKSLKLNLLYLPVFQIRYSHFQ
jgi:hypothetical protein